MKLVKEPSAVKLREVWAERVAVPPINHTDKDAMVITRTPNQDCWRRSGLSTTLFSMTRAGTYGSVQYSGRCQRYRDGDNDTH